MAAIDAGAKFDLAVLDLKLSGPEGDSLDVAAALSRQGTPFVFLTGMREDDSLARYPNAPVVEEAV